MALKIGMKSGRSHPRRTAFGKPAARIRQLASAPPSDTLGVEGDGHMKRSVIILGGVVAGASATAPKAAAKKPAGKPGPAAAHRGKDETGSLPGASSFSPEAVGWELIEDAKTGVRLGVPEKLVPRLGASRSGTRWSSAQGQIQIETFRLPEAALPALFDEERKSAHRQVASS